MLFLLYLLSVQLAQKADITTNIVHVKIILFNAHQEVC